MSGVAERWAAEWAVRLRRLCKYQVTSFKHQVLRERGKGERLSTRTLTANARTTGAIASALRQNINPDVYRSTNILGADCSLAEFCDIIAEAGISLQND